METSENQNHQRTSGSISIASALIISIITLTIITGALCVWQITRWSEQNIEHRESEYLSDLAGNISNNMSLLMDERYADIDTLRDLLELDSTGDTPQQKRVVLEHMLLSNRYFSWLGIVNRNGDIGIATRGLLEGQNVSGRNWFEGAIKNPSFFGNLHPARLLASHITNPDKSPLRLLDIALPIHDAAGNVVGVLGSHLNWKMIEELVQQTLANSSSSVPLSAAVVSVDGTILYDTRGITGNISGLLQQLRQKKMIEATWPYENESSFISTVTVSSGKIFTGLNWKIVLREPAAVVKDRITDVKKQITGISLVVALLFSLFGLFTVRLITRPLNELVRAITLFGDTAAIPEIKVSRRIQEVYELHDSFLKMAANVIQHKQQLQETQTEIVRALARAGEFRDNETGNHVSRMSQCSARLAELAGMNKERVDMIRHASKMHDIGKIGIPDHVLLKPGRFTDEERAIMEHHPVIGARILTGLHTPLTVLARSITLTHHEKWDGSGYPNRLAGKSIPLEGRIVAICDVFDALLSSRPYKEAWPMEKVVTFMHEQAGTHFDPELVALFLRHLDEFIRIRDEFADEPLPDEDNR